MLPTSKSVHFQYKRQLPSSLPNSRQRVNCRSLRQHACVLHLRTDPTKLHLVLPIQNVAVSHALHRSSETNVVFCASGWPLSFAKSDLGSQLSSCRTLRTRPGSSLRYFGVFRSTRPEYALVQEPDDGREVSVQVADALATSHSTSPPQQMQVRTLAKQRSTISQ